MDYVLVTLLQSSEVHTRGGGGDPREFWIGVCREGS